MSNQIPMIECPISKSDDKVISHLLRIGIYLEQLEQLGIRNSHHFSSFIFNFLFLILILTPKKAYVIF